MERAQEACFRVVANPAVITAVAAEREVVGVAFVFDEVVAAPEEDVPDPSRPPDGRAPQQRTPVAGASRLFPIGHVPGDKAVELDRGGVGRSGAPPILDERPRDAVGNGARGELLPALVNDVQL